MKKDEGKVGNGHPAARMAVGAALGILLLMGMDLMNQQQRENDVTILRFGMFAGSNWDVPTGNCYQVIDDAIARFEKANPGVRIEYVSGIRKEDYPEWLAEQVLQGTEPDVFMIPSGEFDLLASTHVLKGLDGLIAEDGDFLPEDYYQAAYQYGNIRKRQYALPYECVPTLMFVNKTLLEREGEAIPDSTWTWEDFLSICRKVTRDTDGDGTTDQFGCYDYSWQDAASSNGASLFNKDGTASNFGDAGLEAAVRFVKELETVSQGYTVTAKDFDKGNVAFRPLAFSEYRTYKPYPWRIKKYSDFEWDCVKMPSGPDGNSHTQLDTLLMGISSRTDHGQLSWEFMKSLCYGEETQLALLEESQGLPPLREMTQSPKLQVLLGEDAPGSSAMDLDVISQVMEEAIEVPNFRRYPSAMFTADTEISRMLKGEASMDTGLLKLQREINEQLKQ